MASPSRVGTSRSTRGREETAWSACIRSRTRISWVPRLSTLLMNSMCGMPLSSRNLNSGASIGALSGVGPQFDRSGAIEEGPALPQIFRGGKPDLDAHLACPGFGRAVAYGVAVLD